MKSPEPIAIKAAPPSPTRRSKAGISEIKTGTNPPTKPGEASQNAVIDAEEGPAAAQAEMEQEGQARNEEAQELESPQEFPEAVQPGKDKGQEARSNPEAEGNEDEKAPAKSKKEPIGRTTRKPNSSIDLDESEQRISLLVRLILDRRGRPLRTEIENAQSGKKDVFSGLAFEELTDYLESCIAANKPSAPPSSPEHTKVPPKKTAGPVGTSPQVSSIDLETTCLSDQGKQALIYSANKPFYVKTVFRIQGLEALPEADRNAPYEISVLAHGIDSNTISVLARFSSNLVSGTNEYSHKLRVTGLPDGLFRLITMLKLPAPLNLSRFSEGPYLRIEESEVAAEVMTGDPSLPR